MLAKIWDSWNFNTLVSEVNHFENSFAISYICIPTDDLEMTALGI